MSEVIGTCCCGVVGSDCELHPSAGCNWAHTPCNPVDLAVPENFCVQIVSIVNAPDTCVDLAGGTNVSHRMSFVGKLTNANFVEIPATEEWCVWRMFDGNEIVITFRVPATGGGYCAIVNLRSNVNPATPKDWFSVMCKKTIATGAVRWALRVPLYIVFGDPNGVGQTIDNLLFKKPRRPTANYQYISQKISLKPCSAPNQNTTLSFNVKLTSPLVLNNCTKCNCLCPSCKGTTGTPPCSSNCLNDP